MECAEAGDNKLAQLPDEMFTIIQHTKHGLGPRLGRLAVPGRKVVDTPHYLGITSRGVVPHLSQDTFARDTSISGVYVPLEDFIERAPYKIPPLYRFKPPDGSSSLRRFIALSEQTLLVLGARRAPPVVAPAANPNTNSTVSICTAVGFRTLKADDYVQAVENLKADIVVGLGDIPYGRALGSKRVEKATDRSIEWLQNHVNIRNASKENNGSAQLFAPLLPVSCANQQFYIDSLVEHDTRKDISGLAVYDTDSLEGLPDALSHLPRVAFTEPSTPHEVLRHVLQGLDILTVPFVMTATDAGIALEFAFPPRSKDDDCKHAAPSPMGIDMWLPTHATDLSPLTEGCVCYTCANHHRAYVQHLLVAKEMLGWVLLQIHNHHVLDLFFAGIRQSIHDGTFENAVQDFERVYEPTLPDKTGHGPRVRGYQYKSEGAGEAKKNTTPFTMLADSKEENDKPGTMPAPSSMLDDGKQKNAEVSPPDAHAGAAELENQGFAEKQD